MLPTTWPSVSSASSMNAAAGLTPRAMAIAASESIRVAVVPGIPTGRQDEQLLEIDLRAVHVGLADEALPERRIAQHLHLATVDGGAQLLPRRRSVERRPGLQAEQHADPSRRRLRSHDSARGVLVLGEAHHGLEQAWASVRLRQTEADRTTALAADLTEQGDLGTGVVEAFVVALAEPHRPFEDARAVAAEHLGEGEEFVRRRVGAGHRAAVGDTMQERAARGNAERTRGHRLVDEPRHRDDVVARSPAPRRAPARPSRRSAARNGRRDRPCSDPSAGGRSSRSTRRTSPSPRPASRGSRRPGCPRRSPSSPPTSPDRPGGTGRT